MLPPIDGKKKDDFPSFETIEIIKEDPESLNLRCFKIGCEHLRKSFHKTLDCCGNCLHEDILQCDPMKDELESTDCFFSFVLKILQNSPIKACEMLVQHLKHFKSISSASTEQLLQVGKALLDQIKTNSSSQTEILKIIDKFSDRKQNIALSMRAVVANAIAKKEPFSSPFSEFLDAKWTLNISFILKEWESISVMGSNDTLYTCRGSPLLSEYIPQPHQKYRLVRKSEELYVFNSLVSLYKKPRVSHKNVYHLQVDETITVIGYRMDGWLRVMLEMNDQYQDDIYNFEEPLDLRVVGTGLHTMDSDPRETNPQAESSREYCWLQNNESLFSNTSMFTLVKLQPGETEELLWTLDNVNHILNDMVDLFEYISDEEHEKWFQMLERVLDANIYSLSVETAQKICRCLFENENIHFSIGSLLSRHAGCLVPTPQALIQLIHMGSFEYLSKCAHLKYPLRDILRCNKSIVQDILLYATKSTVDSNYCLEFLRLLQNSILVSKDACLINQYGILLLEIGTLVLGNSDHAFLHDLVSPFFKAVHEYQIYTLDCFSNIGDFAIILFQKHVDSMDELKTSALIIFNEQFRITMREKRAAKLDQYPFLKSGVFLQTPFVSSATNDTAAALTEHLTCMHLPPDSDMQVAVRRAIQASIIAIVHHTDTIDENALRTFIGRLTRMVIHRGQLFKWWDQIIAETIDEGHFNHSAAMKKMQHLSETEIQERVSIFQKGEPLLCDRTLCENYSNTENPFERAADIFVERSTFLLHFTTRTLPDSIQDDIQLKTSKLKKNNSCPELKAVLSKQALSVSTRNLEPSTASTTPLFPATPVSRIQTNSLDPNSNLDKVEQVATFLFSKSSLRDLIQSVSQDELIAARQIEAINKMRSLISNTDSYFLIETMFDTCMKNPDVGQEHFKDIISYVSAFPQSDDSFRRCFGMMVIAKHFQYFDNFEFIDVFGERVLSSVHQFLHIKAVHSLRRTVNLHRGIFDAKFEPFFAFHCLILIKRNSNYGFEMMLRILKACWSLGISDSLVVVRRLEEFCFLLVDNLTRNIAFENHAVLVETLLDIVRLDHVFKSPRLEIAIIRCIETYAVSHQGILFEYCLPRIASLSKRTAITRSESMLSFGENHHSDVLANVFGVNGGHTQILLEGIRVSEIHPGDTQVRIRVEGASSYRTNVMFSRINVSVNGVDLDSKFTPTDGAMHVIVFESVVNEIVFIKKFQVDDIGLDSFIEDLPRNYYFVIVYSPLNNPTRKLNQTSIECFQTLKSSQYKNAFENLVLQPYIWTLVGSSSEIYSEYWLPIENEVEFEILTPHLFNSQDFVRIQNNLTNTIRICIDEDVVELLSPGLLTYLPYTQHATLTCALMEVAPMSKYKQQKIELDQHDGSHAVVAYYNRGNRIWRPLLADGVSCYGNLVTCTMAAQQLVAKGITAQVVSNPKVGVVGHGVLAAGNDSILDSLIDLARSLQTRSPFFELQAAISDDLFFALVRVFNGRTSYNLGDDVLIKDDDSGSPSIKGKVHILFFNGAGVLVPVVDNEGIPKVNETKCIHVPLTRLQNKDRVFNLGLKSSLLDFKQNTYKALLEKLNQVCDPSRIQLIVRAISHLGAIEDMEYQHSLRRHISSPLSTTNIITLNPKSIHGGFFDESLLNVSLAIPGHSVRSIYTNKPSTSKSEFKISSNEELRIRFGFLIEQEVKFGPLWGPYSYFYDHQTNLSEETFECQIVKDLVVLSINGTVCSIFKNMNTNIPVFPAICFSNRYDKPIQVQLQSNFGQFSFKYQHDEFQNIGMDMDEAQSYLYFNGKYHQHSLLNAPRKERHHYHFRILKNFELCPSGNVCAVLPKDFEMQCEIIAWINECRIPMVICREECRGLFSHNPVVIICIQECPELDGHLFLGSRFIRKTQLPTSNSILEEQIDFNSLMSDDLMTGEEDHVHEKNELFRPAVPYSRARLITSLSGETFLPRKIASHELDSNTLIVDPPHQNKNILNQDPRFPVGSNVYLDISKLPKGSESNFEHVTNTFGRVLQLTTISALVEFIEHDTNAFMKCWLPKACLSSLPEVQEEEEQLQRVLRLELLRISNPESPEYISLIVLKTDELQQCLESSQIPETITKYQEIIPNNFPDLINRFLKIMKAQEIGSRTLMMTDIPSNRIVPLENFSVHSVITFAMMDSETDSIHDSPAKFQILENNIRTITCQSENFLYSCRPMVVNGSLAVKLFPGGGTLPKSLTITPYFSEILFLLHIFRKSKSTKAHAALVEYVTSNKIPSCLKSPVLATLIHLNSPMCSISSMVLDTLIQLSPSPIGPKVQKHSLHSKLLFEFIAIFGKPSITHHFASITFNLAASPEIKIAAKMVAEAQVFCNQKGVNIMSLETIDLIEMNSQNERLFAKTHEWNRILDQYIHLIDFRSCTINDGWCLPACISRCRQLIYSSISCPLFESMIENSACMSLGNRATVVIDRWKAEKSSIPRSYVTGRVQDEEEVYILVDDSDKDSVFMQAYKQLGTIPASVLRYSNPHIAFEVELLSERVAGETGPYREFFSTIGSELQQCCNSLLVPTPNNQCDVGEGKNLFTLSPSNLLHFDHYKFLGRLIGCALRTNVFLPLNLCSLFWKQITSTPIGLSDLRLLDVIFVNSHENLRFHLSDQVIREKSTMQQVLSSRLNESSAQIQAVKRGIEEIIPSSVLSVLSWDVLRDKVVGAFTIDVVLLRRHTIYGSELDPKLIDDFWTVLESFSNRERQLFVKFVWGQEHIPCDDNEFISKSIRMLIKAAPYHEQPDNRFPRSDTCFFNLELPSYSTRSIMAKQILIAVNITDTLDGDETYF